jgi:3-oxoacyl-[acyl-carrier-protein] synthase III
VRIASSYAQKTTKRGSDVDDAREFLKVGTKVRKLAAGDAAEAYEKMLDDGKLEYDDRSWVAPSQGRLLSSQRSIISTTPQLMERVLDWPLR